ncbi:MAG: hypothetical protein RR672_13760 [Raoultibacter sp.]
MYLSKAMQNMRGNPLPSTQTLSVVNPFMPQTFASYNTTGLSQAYGSAIWTEVNAAIVFSTGDTISDNLWNGFLAQSSLYSLNSLRAFLSTNLPGCVMDTSFISSGLMRIIQTDPGVRTFECTDGALGHLTYAKAFNRMYILLGHSGALAVGTANMATAIELTPQDLQQMGAALTDNGDGTFTLTSKTIALNNISFS